MPTLTIAQAQSHYDAWLAADLALATSQEYTIEVQGSRRTLRRVDAEEVRANLAYWGRVLTRLESGSGGARVRRVVPL